MVIRCFEPLWLASLPGLLNLVDALKAGYRAVGVSVLQPLYAKMKDKTVVGDLDTLWAKLGVQSDDAGVRFDDNAVLAEIRRLSQRANLRRRSIPCLPNVWPHSRAVPWLLRHLDWRIDSRHGS